MVGLDRDRVELEPYRPEWQERYEVEIEHLSSILGDSINQFEHVGSTAVRGLPAKPIIDILALVEELPAAKAIIDPLEDADYTLRSEDSDRLFFAKGPESNRTHYLHVTEAGSKYAAEMLTFRDHLRSNPNVADEYADMKRSLADRFPEDRERYTDHKAEFIERTLEDALQNL